MKRKLLVYITVFSIISCINEEKVKNVQDNNTFEHQSQLLEDAVSNKPDSLLLRSNLIDALDSIGDYQKALKHIKILISRDSLNYGFWYRKGKLEASAGDTNQAIISYSVAAKIYTSPEVLLELANLYAEKKKPATITICSQIKNLKPDNIISSYADFYIGVYYARIAEKQKAHQFFDKSIANNYQLYEAYMEKGYLYYDNGNTSEAHKIFKMITNINKTYADAYYWMAKCDEKQKKYADAKNNYAKSLALNNTLSEAKVALLRLSKY